MCGSDITINKRHSGVLHKMSTALYSMEISERKPITGELSFLVIHSHAVHFCGSQEKEKRAPT